MYHSFSIQSAGYFTGKAARNYQGHGFRVKITLPLVSFGVTWTPGTWQCPHTCLGGAWVHEDFLPFERVLAPLVGGGAGAELGQQQADVLVLNSVLSKSGPSCEWFSVSEMLLTCCQPCTAVLEKASRSEGIGVLGRGILLFIFPY